MRRALLASAAVAAFVACIPNPKGDFEDFLEEVGPFLDDGAVPEAGPVDSVAPTEAIEGLYYTACLSALSFGDLNKVLRFYTQTKFTPDAAGQGGTISIRLAPLKGWNTETASAEPPASVARSEIRGPEVVAENVAVDARGGFVANVGKVELEREANPISGRAITLENVVFKGFFGTNERFCTRLSANVTQPIQQPLTEAQNACIFIKATEGDALKAVTPAEYEPAACPGP